MKFENKKVLVAYFSHAGEVYMNGILKQIQVGNTNVVAKKIREMTKGDEFFIDTVKEYPGKYMDKIDVAKQELQAHARPQIKNPLLTIDTYDTIFLCYPNWWSTCPMAVFSFLESYDFTNKTIIPVCTHEGSGLGNSVSDIKKICPNSRVLEGFAILGSKVQQSETVINEWMGEM